MKNANEVINSKTEKVTVKEIKERAKTIKSDAAASGNKAWKRLYSWLAYFDNVTLEYDNDEVIDAIIYIAKSGNKSIDSIIKADYFYQ